MNDPAVVSAVIAGLVALVLIVFLIRRRSGRVPAPVRADTGSSTTLGSSLRRILGGGPGEQAWAELEDALLAADLGVQATSRVIDAVRERSPATSDEARRLIGEVLLDGFEDGPRALNLWGEPAVVLVVGVNGSGKTTTVAKLAHMLKSSGKSVLLAAADTFRAAGSDQLAVWGERIGVPVVTGQEGGDPAAVVHDALASARARSADVVVVDTAGRLHANKNLMSELSKVHRVAGGAESVGEVLLVIDASAGQNGLAQAREFSAAVPVTGVVLAKLDGTARGGIVVAVEMSLGIPVKLVGTGETIGGLEAFEPARFVPSLLA